MDAVTQGDQCHFVLSTHVDNLPGINQTKNLIRAIIMIKAIIRIKNKIRK